MKTEKYNLQEIEHNIYKIENDDACIYVLAGTERAAVIDTGYGTFNLLEAVRRLTEKPITVLCTHGHSDHVLGGGYFEKVYLNDKEIPLMLCYDTAFKEEARTRVQARFELSDVQIENWIHLGFPAIVPLNPEMKFDLGGYSLDTVDLCGHTQGSMGFICKEARILFSGDGLIERVWMHLPESAPVQRYYASIRQIDLRKQEFDQIYTGHKNAHKPVTFLQELIGLLEQVMEEKKGTPINTGTASGLLAGNTGCQIIFKD